MIYCRNRLGEGVFVTRPGSGLGKQVRVGHIPRILK